jgi:pimeloyl-ACP methyl ester carboxylesterase
MPQTKVRGVDLVYNIIGESGPLLALVPGGRRAHDELVPLAKKIAAAGFRILLHDRRNTGASEIRIEGEQSEESIWVDDLRSLLLLTSEDTPFVGGFSSGSRVSMLFATRYTKALRGLLLCRVTGGATAAMRLPENYYGQFIKAAMIGGMAAVCETPQYQERIAANPQNRSRLMALDPMHYIEIMSRWRDQFVAGAHHKVMGLTAAELGLIEVPTMIIPGNDMTHSDGSAVAAHAAIPGAELHRLPLTHQDRDLIPYEEWAPHEDEIAAVYVGFMRRVMAEARERSQ